MYSYILHPVVSGPTCVTMYMRSIVPTAYVGEEQKKYGVRSEERKVYGMARDGTCTCAPDNRASYRSPTEDSRGLRSVYQKSEGGASLIRCTYHMRTPCKEGDPLQGTPR